MIPEAVLNQIQDRVDIVEVVGAAITLKRAGRNFKANCPFHGEKTPSFIVNPDKQIFHCFGCGVGGNVFGFLMKFEKKDFREVVEDLAERFGVEIPKDRVENSAALQRAAQLLKAHELASEFYQKFFADSKEAARAREYLKARGIREDVCKEFKIGFAPEAWDSLYRALKDGVGESVLEKSGLVLPKKGGGFYDRFRNRILFPILDAKGACIAFGGRVMDDSLPKYLNSPETEIYSKGKNLYGFFQARKSIRENDFVIMVEGYMDLIACHQAGVTNAVASLGTALTTEQARLIRRNTLNAVMLYDADKAGEMATLRGLEVFLEEGMDVKIVRLPEGHDPDSFIKQRGAPAFKDELGRAKTLFDYKLALLKAQHDGRSVEGRVRIGNEMVLLLAKVKNDILKAAWLRELAKELNLSEEALISEMKKGGKTVAAKPQTPVSPAPAKVASATEMPLAEKMVLGVLLEDVAFVERAREEIRAENFQHPAARKIAEKIFESPGITAAQLMNVFAEDAEIVRAVSLACAESEKAPDKRKVLADCFGSMKRSQIRVQREGLRFQIVTAEKQGDRHRISELLRDLDELNKREKQINEKK